MRQITKNALAQRVIDEHQLDRHFTRNQLRELYQFYPDEDYDGLAEYAFPKDEILKELLLKNQKWICKYHEHDSLLENNEAERLSEEERTKAWKDYEESTKVQDKPDLVANLNEPVTFQEEEDSLFHNFYNQYHQNTDSNSYSDSD